MNHLFEVALLAEGVDRNLDVMVELIKEHQVALLAEGVDRNIKAAGVAILVVASPSSRRAWIEMISPDNTYKVKLVALLAEGVDRNIAARMLLSMRL